jgi:hypothetical protein
MKNKLLSVEGADWSFYKLDRESIQNNQDWIAKNLDSPDSKFSENLASQKKRFQRSETKHALPRPFFLGLFLYSQILYCCFALTFVASLLILMFFIVNSWFPILHFINLFSTSCWIHFYYV